MNTPRDVDAVANYSAQKISGSYWTLVLMETFGSTEKEPPNDSPKLKGRW